MKEYTPHERFMFTNPSNLIQKGIYIIVNVTIHIIIKVIIVKEKGRLAFFLLLQTLSHRFKSGETNEGTNKRDKKY